MSRPSAILLVLLIVGAARFAYALGASPQGWSGTTYMESVYDLHRVSGGAYGTGLKRKWGPLFIALMSALERVPVPAATLRVLIRLVLTLIYAATVYLMSRLFTDITWPWSAGETRARQALLIFLSLQSTPAIYAITNGMGEIVTAFCIISHFILFSKQRLAAAAAIMALGIYFKLFPIVFAFPYFVFSLLSGAHRRYGVALVVSCLLVALASVPVAGWQFGFFYPLSMMGFVVTDADVIPILSKEVFNLAPLIARAASSFKVREVDAQAMATARTLAPLFSALLMASTAATAVWLWRYERVWNANLRSRQVALLVFQSIIGFLMFLLSTDVSITGLLLISVSLYSPLWLFLEPVRDRARSSRLALVTIGLFGAGVTLAGNLVPLSILYRMLPLASLDRLAGNPPTALIAQEKYI